MLDKNLIKEKFKKSIKTYNDNAIVQKKTSEKLVSLTGKKDFENILEIGSYSGILTKIANENFNFKNYLALDIVEESRFYIEKINPEIKFLNSDIEDFTTNEKFDLIIANASLQWCNDFKKVVYKLQSFLSSKGTLAIVIFNQDNLFEIKDIFNIGLNYPKISEIKEIFPSNTVISADEITLRFNTPKDALKHLKLTGVNAIQKNNLSFSEIKKGLEILDKKYQNQLTYKPLYIICQHP